jgi:hypothetical protein
MPRSQHSELARARSVERVRPYEDSIDPPLRERRERLVDFTRRASLEDKQPSSERSRAFLRGLLKGRPLVRMRRPRKPSARSGIRCRRPSGCAIAPRRDMADHPKNEAISARIITWDDGLGVAYDFQGGNTERMRLRMMIGRSFGALSTTAS